MLKMALYHVDVMSSPAAGVTPDKPGIKGRRVIAPGRPPEVVVSLRFQDGHNPAPGLFEACDLHQHIDDRLCSKAGHGGAAEVLDSRDEYTRQTCQQMFLLFEK